MKDNETRCCKCGKKYKLTPVYIYDDWNVGHYGAVPKEILDYYKNDGCPYCREKAKNKKEAYIKSLKKKINKCQICGKGTIDRGIYTDKYYVRCNCLRTNKEVEYEKLETLIDLWNKNH